MRPQRSISQLAVSSAWYDDWGLGMSCDRTGVSLDSVVRARPAVPLYPTCGNNAERVCVSTPADCSTLAAATLTLRLCASASTIIASSTGSLNCFHHSVLTVSAASFVSLMKELGVSTCERR